MHLSKLSSVILKEDNKHLRHYAPTKSTAMIAHSADRMFVTSKALIYISCKLSQSRSDIFPLGGN